MKKFIKNFLIIEVISLAAGSAIYFFLKTILKRFPLERDITRAMRLTEEYPVFFIAVFCLVFSFFGSLWLKNFKRKSFLRKNLGIIMILIFSIIIGSGVCSLSGDILTAIVTNNSIYLSHLTASFGLGVTFGSVLFLLSAPLSIVSIFFGYLILYIMEKFDKVKTINITANY